MLRKLKSILNPGHSGEAACPTDHLEASALKPSALAHCRVFPERTAALELVKAGGTIVEVGVAYGDFSSSLLSRLQPKRFIAIDSFSHLGVSKDLWGSRRLKESNLSHLDFYKDRFRSEIVSGTMKVLQGLSWDCLSELEDASADLIYIDADHSYASVLRDLNCALTKVKPDGVIQLNDYTNFDPIAKEPYGVMKAANEVINAHNLTVAGFAFHPLGFHDICLRVGEWNGS